MGNIATELNRILSRAHRSVTDSSNSELSSWTEPEGWCEPCLDAHKCHACHDAGRVRVKVLQDGEVYADAVERGVRIGQTVLCRCVFGAVADPVRQLARMNIPALLRDETLASWQPNNGRPRIETQNFSLINPWPGEQFFLVLSGPPGRGKTHLAVGAMKAVLAAHNVAGRFVVVPELLDRIKATYNEESRTETTEQVLGEMTACKMLTLDDLGAEKSTEWAQEQLFKIINARYAAKLATIITTNLTVANLDERVFSRICNRQTAVVVDIDGSKFADHRLAR